MSMGDIHKKSSDDFYANAEMVPNLFQIGTSTYLVVPADKQSLDMMGISTLESSTAAAKRPLLGAGTPNLEEPSFYVADMNMLTEVGLKTGGLEGVSKNENFILINMLEFTRNVNETKHKVIMKMLENWSESIKDEAKKVQVDVLLTRYKQEMEKKSDEAHERERLANLPITDPRALLQSENDFQQWVNSLPQAEQIKLYKYSTLSGIESGAAAYRDLLNEGGPSVSAPFIMATMAIGGSMMGTYVTMITEGVKAGAHTAINPIVTAVVQMSKPILDLGTAAMGYLGSIFATGVIYQTSDSIALNVGRMPTKEINFRFAQEYAKNMMILIDSPDFQRFLSGSVIGLVRDGKQMTAGDREQLVKGMEVILLFAALGLVYKSETGKLTDQEVGEIVTGKLDVSDDPSVKGKLAQMIRERVVGNQLGKLEQPLLNAILEYLNQDPKLDELFDVHKVFEGIRQSSALTEAIHLRGRG